MLSIYYIIHNINNTFNFAVTSIDHDLKLKRQYCTNRCTNTIDEDGYFYILAGKTTKTTFSKIYSKFG